MKPLTKTVVSRGGGKKPQKPRYARWREANPELYKERQAGYMRKRRAKEREK